MTISKPIKLEKYILKENATILLETEVKDFIQSNLDEFISWFSALTLTKKAPSGVNKVDHSVLLNIRGVVDEYVRSTLPNHLKSKMFLDRFVMNSYNLRITKEEIEDAYSDTSSKPEKIATQYATYYKDSSFAYQTFLDDIERLDTFFSKLGKPHNLALKNLHIYFKDAKDSKAIASYKTQQDAIHINPKRVSSLQNVYGSLEYVILHELGHRYLRYNSQSWDYDSSVWKTTKYSMTDSFSGEEKFAELFALSFWKKDYSEYKDVIEKFLDILE